MNPACMHDVPSPLFYRETSSYRVRSLPLHSPNTSLSTGGQVFIIEPTVAVLHGEIFSLGCLVGNCSVPHQVTCPAQQPFVSFTATVYGYVWQFCTIECSIVSCLINIVTLCMPTTVLLQMDDSYRNDAHTLPYMPRHWPICDIHSIHHE